MNFTRRASRLVVGTLDAATSTVGAVGGAAVGAVAGGVRGSAVGLKDGLVDGSHSTPAALVTLGTLGAVGLVEWPVLVGIGTVALLVRYLRHDQPDAIALRPNASGATPAPPTPIRRATPAKPQATRATAPTKATPTKGKAAPAKAVPTKAAPRKAAARTASRSRRTPAKP